MAFTFLKKCKVEIVFSLILAILYFTTRLLTLTILPIFTDEAIYLRWAQIGANDANWRFISLTDGKQPLFSWFMMVSMKIFTDPIFAGRIVSVFAGFGTMIGLFFLTREIFKNRWIGLIAAGLYVLFPFALVYDRMALYDSMVGTFAVWGLYAGVLLARYVRLDIALIFGMVAGAGVLNKTSGFFTIYLLPFTLLIFQFHKKVISKRLLKWSGLVLLSVSMTYAIYSILRLSPFFHIIAQKDAVFVYPFGEWLKHPFNYFFSNLIVGQLDWLVRYVGIPFIVLALCSFIIKKTYTREKMLLILWFAIPFLLLALFGNTLYPRYIFFMTLFLLPLVAYSLYSLHFLVRNRVLFSGVISAFLFYSLILDIFILYNFAAAPIPSSDVNQYNNDWPSGDGVRESISFFEQQAKNQKIFVATQGTFGLLPYAYELYLLKNPNITLKGYWPIGETVPPEVLTKRNTMPTFFVFYQPCPACLGKGLAPKTWNAEIVYQKKKTAYDAYFTVYQVREQ